MAIGWSFYSASVLTYTPTLCLFFNRTRSMASSWDLPTEPWRSPEQKTRCHPYARGNQISQSDLHLRIARTVAEIESRHAQHHNNKNWNPQIPVQPSSQSPEGSQALLVHTPVGAGAQCEEEYDPDFPEILVTPQSDSQLQKYIHAKSSRKVDGKPNQHPNAVNLEHQPTQSLAQHQNHRVVAGMKSGDIAATVANALTIMKMNEGCAWTFSSEKYTRSLSPPPLNPSARERTHTHRRQPTMRDARSSRAKRSRVEQPGRANNANDTSLYPQRKRSQVPSTFLQPHCNVPSTREDCIMASRMREWLPAV
jgi:hypothetical protein